MKACEDFEKIENEDESYDWRLRHTRCPKDEDDCECPPRPEIPDSPNIDDYVREVGERCALTETLAHSDVQKQHEKSFFE